MNATAVLTSLGVLLWGGAPLVPAPEAKVRVRPQLSRPLLVRPTTPDPNAFPSDAECQALGPVRTPLPFKPGESLDFDVDAIGIRAGSMNMLTLQPRDGMLPVEVTVQTNTFFSKIRKVEGLARSELSPVTVRPSRYFEDAFEGPIHRVSDARFQKKNNVHAVNTIDGKTWAEDLHWGNDVTDVAGAVHLLRSLPLQAGQRMCFDVYAIRRVWRVWGEVKPREHVSSPLGEFETWHLAGQAARLDLPDARREVHVWITDDERRLPLAALGMIDLGVVRAALKDYSRPGEPKPRAEAATVKW